MQKAIFQFTHLQPAKKHRTETPLMFRLSCLTFGLGLLARVPEKHPSISSLLQCTKKGTTAENNVNLSSFFQSLTWSGRNGSCIVYFSFAVPECEVAFYFALSLFLSLSLLHGMSFGVPFSWLAATLFEAVRMVSVK